MKLIVQEYVSRIAEPHKKVFSITADAVGSYNTIPLSIGLSKGDLIAFRGEGDPIRISSGGVDGRVLVVDSSTESGWKVAPMSGSDTAVTLHNGTGAIIPGGTVVKISSGAELALATSSDTSMLFVTSEDCNDDADVVCYGTTNTICSIRCTSDAVAIGDELGVSSTPGVAKKVTSNGFAKALTAKASGSTGTVTAIFVQSGFLPLTGGTVTGNVNIGGNLTFESSSVVKYHGNKSTSTMIEFLNNTVDAYGNGVVIGGGGATIIGGGEAANAVKVNGNVSAGDERLVLCNDGGIDIWTNCQSGNTDSATKRTIDISGNFNGKAANVTGTVAIANGGTGATTAAAAWTALGGGSIGKKNSLAASDIPAHSTDKLTSGTLPVARGGTGQTSLQATRNAMGLGNTTGALPIANGGTGATTRLNAVKALTNENVGTSAQYFLTITDNWGKCGYSNVANAKSVLGIADSGWKTLTNSSVFNGTIYYRLHGMTLFIASGGLTLKNQLNANSTVTLVTLPSGYRPSTWRYGSFDSQGWNSTGLCWIDTNGNITIRANSGAAFPASYNFNITIVSTNN